MRVDFGPSSHGDPASAELQPSYAPISYFIKIRNVGDALNPILVDKLFGLDTRWSDRRQPHITAIGSLTVVSPLSCVWGSGLMHEQAKVEEASASRIFALRGKLSYAQFVRSGIRPGDIPLGDPGFLISQLHLAPTFKKFRIGIAAHYVDRDHPWVRSSLLEPGVADLNVHHDPESFLQRMRQCEVVVSSSLHGLVFAEALGIPSIWIRLSDSVAGDGFKFRDWYSLAAEPPETMPALPGETLDAVASRAALHDMRIDIEGLKSSFPSVRLPSSRPTFKAGNTRLAPPIFVLSFNRAKQLGQVVESYRRLSPSSDIVVHDFGSEDPETLDVLDQLEGNRIQVERSRKIANADQLEEVNASIARYFEHFDEPQRYVVTDCDVDLSIADQNTLRMYDALLDRFPEVDCVGPMLRIRDVPPSYPLYARVMNKQVGKFWRNRPQWVRVNGRKVAYLEAKIDTTFALHRAGRPFKRLRKGLRVYHPYEARHLDWYCSTEDFLNAYATSASPGISHWSTLDALHSHCNEALKAAKAFIVTGDPSGRPQVETWHVGERSAPEAAPLPTRPLESFDSRPASLDLILGRTADAVGIP